MCFLGSDWTKSDQLTSRLEGSLQVVGRNPGEPRLLLALDDVHPVLVEWEGPGRKGQDQ